MELKLPPENCTRNPIMVGARNPAIWFPKLMIPMDTPMIPLGITVTGIAVIATLAAMRKNPARVLYAMAALTLAVL